MSYTIHTPPTCKCFIVAAAGMILACSMVAMGYDRGPDEELQTEWAAVQGEKDQEAKSHWWTTITASQLGVLIEEQIDVTVTDKRGWTPLHSAARYCTDPTVLDALIDAGAVVDAIDRSGDTPLHWAAAENPNVAVIERLIAAGANVNARDRFGWLPIHTAASTNTNPQVIEKLMEEGADQGKRAYFFMFKPTFMLRHNKNMSERDKESALLMLSPANE